MTTKKNLFAIMNQHSGAHLGCYRAESEAAALDIFAQDAGYRDYADLEAQVPSQPGEMIVREIASR